MSLSARHKLLPANDNLSIDELYRRYLTLVDKIGREQSRRHRHRNGTGTDLQATSA